MTAAHETNGKTTPRKEKLEAYWQERCAVENALLAGLAANTRRDFRTKEQLVDCARNMAETVMQDRKEDKSRLGL